VPVVQQCPDRHLGDVAFVDREVTASGNAVRSTRPVRIDCHQRSAFVA
jgi:hypothetical protein